MTNQEEVSQRRNERDKKRKKVGFLKEEKMCHKKGEGEKDKQKKKGGRMEKQKDKSLISFLFCKAL